MALIRGSEVNKPHFQHVELVTGDQEEIIRYDRSEIIISRPIMELQRENELPECFKMEGIFMICRPILEFSGRRHWLLAFNIERGWGVNGER